MKFNPQPKSGMPPKKAKKPLKRTAIKKKYVKRNNDNSKGYIGGFSKPTKKQSKPSGEDKIIARKTPIVRRRKSTGEAKVFRDILEKRGPYSQISGEYLGEGFNPWWFSHCVPKSIAPELRLDERNIILKTPEEHILYENHKHKIRHLPEWEWVFELEEKLKREINNSEL